jgi:hypothetical protein
MTESLGYNMGAGNNFQKTALMEEFEELSKDFDDSAPSSDLNDFIHMQKEIRRLNEDNKHLAGENKQLYMKLKKYENSSRSNLLADDFVSVSSSPTIMVNVEAQQQQIQEYENTIEGLKQEIFVSGLFLLGFMFKLCLNLKLFILNSKTLKNRLSAEKDRHQDEIVAIQDSYANKTDKQLSEKQSEIEIVRIKLEELQTNFDEKLKELEELKDSKKNISGNLEEATRQISSGKSDDGWCLNGKTNIIKLNVTIELFFY